MYTVAVKRDFVAQHYLVGGNWGPENDLHSHHYAIELQLEGAELDQHGYLVDIVDIETNLEALVDDRYTLGIVVPLAEQMYQARQSLSHLTPKIDVAVASPYGPLEAVHEAAAELYQNRVDLVVLHCMGFSGEHRQVMRAVTQKPVLVANSIVARTLAELLAR